MIASNFKAACSSALALSLSFLNFLIMSHSPCVGRFSVGELNVI
jgi:hypothetical protein